MSQPKDPKKQTEQSEQPFDFPVTWAKVHRVVDGDTIVLANRQRVRYIGINTPEKDTEPPHRYARRAQEKNRQLVEGQRVALRKDVSETDHYDRLLRYVYLPNGEMVNALLIQGGYARVIYTPPDLLFLDVFRRLEREARRERRGMWR